jgi:hypothetical protein
MLPGALVRSLAEVPERADSGRCGYGPAVQSSVSEWIVVIIFGGGIIALWLWILYLALRVPRERWAEAGQSRPLWIFLIIVLGVLGAALYLMLVAPSLSPQRE